MKCDIDTLMSAVCWLITCMPADCKASSRLYNVVCLAFLAKRSNSSRTNITTLWPRPSSCSTSLRNARFSARDAALLYLQLKDLYGHV